MSDEQRRRFLASGDLITIAEASKLTPYSSEYLGLLARKGRFSAIKISRDWLTTRSAVLSYVEVQGVKHRQMADKFEYVAAERGEHV